MTHLISRRWAIILLILIPLIVSSACLTLTGSSPIETQSPEVTGSSPTETQAPEVIDGSPADSQAPEEIFVQGDVVFGPGAFNFLEPAAGLSDLSSYKATLSLSFDGTEAGQPSQWSKTYAMLVTLEPVARQLTIEKSGQVSDPDPVFMAEVAGAAYEWRGENACTATMLEPGDSLAEQMEPAGFLTGVIGAEEAGSETVNGVAANHYTFDERALGQLDLAQSTGEMWIASDGGYIVKYLLTTKGNADYFGEGIEGTITWDYALTDVNQPLTVELPKDCPAGMVDAPLLPDAADVVNVQGVLTYTTATSVADAAAFYQQQLPDLGWQLVADPVVAETLAVQDFTREDQQLSVTILVDEDGTTVQLVLGPIQP